MRPFAYLTIAVAVAWWLAAADARAGQMIVVSDSAAIGFARGALVEEGTSLKIPAGERLALIDANGRGLTVRGPFDGPLRASGAGDTGGPAVMAAMRSILDAPATLAIGAVRKAGDGPQPPDPHLIDVSDDATVCVAEGGGAALWRPTPTRRVTLFLTRLATGERAEAEWPANQPTLAWPATMPIVDGEAYQVALAGALSKPRLEVKIVPVGAVSVASAKRLADAGCRHQALTMLEAIAATDTR